jgi:hypothetical protein
MKQLSYQEVLLLKGGDESLEGGGGATWCNQTTKCGPDNLSHCVKDTTGTTPATSCYCLSYPSDTSCSD